MDKLILYKAINVIWHMCTFAIILDTIIGNTRFQFLMILLGIVAVILGPILLILRYQLTGSIFKDPRNHNG